MTSLISVRRIAAVCMFVALSFFAVAVSSAQAATPIVINNPGVEASTTVPTLPDFWAQGGYGVSSTTLSYEGVTGHTGKGVSVTITNYVSGDAKWVFDPVTLSSDAQGGLITFSNWYKSTVSSRLVAALSGGTDAQHPDIYVTIANLPAAADWTQATVTFTPYLGYTKVTVYHLIEANGTLTTDDYSLELTTPAAQNLFSQGLVSLTFDDGWRTQYDTARPILDTANFKATFYLIGKAISQAVANPGAGYFNPTEMIALSNQGHEIAGHTESHCNLVRLFNGLPSNSIDNCAFPETGLTWQGEIASGTATLVANGATSTISNFAYPNGATNASIKSYVQSLGYTSARTVDEGYNTKQSDLMALKVEVVDANTTFTQVKGWIDTAIANKFWLILVFHQIDNPATIVSNGEEGGTTPQTFQDIVTYLSTQPAGTVKTVREALSLMGVNPPQPADTTAPVIAAHADVFATTTATSGIAVTYTNPTATDNVDATVGVSCTPVSGSIFAIGSTTVTCVAHDTALNYATTPFVVGVSLSTSTEPVPTPTPEPTPTPTPTPAPSSGGGSGSGGGGGGGGGIVGGGPLSIGFVNTNPTGSVLGAQTSSPSCYQFLTTLQVGSTGADVIALQTRLTQEGLFTATATGYFGSITKAAVMAFQQKYGVSPVGIVGPQTRAVLNASCAPTTPTTPSTGSVLGAATGIFTQTLMQGSTGAEVTMLQKVLIDLGFLKIVTPTGFFGSLTKAAVMGYQTSRGIEAVGIVGPKTRQALNSNAAAVQ